MAQYNTTSTADGILKEIYADGIVNLLPESAVLTKLIPFNSAKKIGKTYNQPVRLTGEHGITFSSSGVATLNTAVAQTIGNAAVPAFELFLRSQLSYDLVMQADSDRKSFENVADLLVTGMLEDATRYTEIELLYGGDGIGTTSSSANTNATTTVATFTTASWADGIWSGMEGQVIEFYDSTNTIVSSGANADFIVSAVNPDSRTVTFTGTAAGITALDTAIAAGACDAYFNGSNGNEMSGLKAILTNTGTLFGLSATTYSLWRGNTYSASSAALNFGKLNSAISRAVARGLNEAACLIVNPKTWHNLNSNEAALRMYDSSYKKTVAENGVEKLSYHGSNGVVEVYPHNICKEGDAFLFPKKKIQRIGSQDWAFMPADGDNERLLWNVPDVTAYELRVATGQSLFLETPARGVYVNEIVNTNS